MWRTAPPFGELLAGCQRSAVHLEMRDHYDDPDEAPRVVAWKSGCRLNPTDRASWWRPWLDMVAEAVARGVEFRRARIVSEPVSEYTRYLYDGTFTNIAAGEQIRWLARRQASDIALPGNDFWLFDGRLVRFGYFSGEGTYLGDEVTDEPAVAKLCADAFESVWAKATPHEEYKI
ncbi:MULTISPECIES: DUF6879 family protein [unclassified Streptomyces]|uniref:DUF6879 family protein n=1 Tax=unclassified Streptomyces TaxID=2593676 RepID=UPI00081DD3BA|nr:MULTISPECIES: DUF6879 family protein [unclassified Streptomyces]MYZ36360.1 hypothetical protein [Streptomyces sp. SID4917]SCF82943.1 hypothetical protein GA0115259_1032711 [Streptomyces sp. MnatMP-M17]